MHFRRSSFGNACTFFRFSKLGQLRFWKTTINLSTVLGIPSSYFSNQRLKLKLTVGTMNSSFGNDCSFFRFCKLRQLRFWKKQSMHRSRNTFKLFFKSKIKVEINHWDHEFQFRECLEFLPFLQVEAVAFLETKTINLCTVLGITSSYFSNQRLKLKLTIGTMNSSFRNAWSFFRFCKLRQLRSWKKNN